MQGITYPDILGTVGRTPLNWLKRVVPSHLRPTWVIPDSMSHERRAIWRALGADKNRGKTIVTFACSSGERYLSTPLYGLVGMPELHHSLTLDSLSAGFSL